MFLSRSLLSFFGIGTLLGASVEASENWVLLGDSLTKEYALEFPLLHPGNPAAWSERNWIELLAEHRAESVDIGSLSIWPDSRLTGHEYNWAFPGSTSSEWAEILTSSFFDSPEDFFLRSRLDPYLTNVAERVVVFLGGNDLKNNYGTYYEGADPASFIDDLVANMRTIISYVRARNATVPIVLATMPDVGVTPTVQDSKPDPEKRRRNTELTEEVNRRLRALAEENGIGVADIGVMAAELSGPRHYVIGGIRFFKGVDPESLSNEPVYLFSPDGFHPNTVAQLRFANAIVEGFNQAYPDLPPVRPFSSEEMLRILGLNPDMPFADWAAAYGVDPDDPLQDADGDDWPAIAEFAFGTDPREADAGEPMGRWVEGRLELEYPLRLLQSEHLSAEPESSSDLKNWTVVPQTQRGAPGDHRFSAWIETAPEGPDFLRLAFAIP